MEIYRLCIQQSRHVVSTYNNSIHSHQPSSTADHSAKTRRDTPSRTMISSSRLHFLVGLYTVIERTNRRPRGLHDHFLRRRATRSTVDTGKKSANAGDPSSSPCSSWSPLHSVRLPADTCLEVRDPETSFPTTELPPDLEAKTSVRAIVAAAAAALLDCLNGGFG